VREADLMQLSIQPKLGLGDIRLGMSETDVTAILGLPESEGTVEGDLEVYYGNDINVCFRDGKAIRIGATRRAKGILCDELDIFDASPLLVLQRLEKQAGKAFECYGFIVFPALGIALTGFHDSDIDDKAITVSIDGSWDDLEEQFVPITFLTSRPTEG
jgi:hypothetical protein